LVQVERLPASRRVRQPPTNNQSRDHGSLPKNPDLPAHEGREKQFANSQEQDYHLWAPFTRFVSYSIDLTSLSKRRLIFRLGFLCAATSYSPYELINFNLRTNYDVRNSGLVALIYFGARFGRGA
jgi:hypothetical protein